MLSLESHHSCHYDYVEVRDGDSVNSRVIGRFCGNSRPPPVHSSGSSLHVLFVSDGYKNFDGFFATFQEISGTSNMSDFSINMNMPEHILELWLRPQNADTSVTLIGPDKSSVDKETQGKTKRSRV